MSRKFELKKNDRKNRQNEKYIEKSTFETRKKSNKIVKLEVMVGKPLKLKKWRSKSEMIKNVFKRR